MCRRSARQCIARLNRLCSTLHPPPGSGNFASRILRAEHFHGENMKGKKAAILSANLFTRRACILFSKQSAVASGISYGWEPFRNEDGPVSFGETGHTTKP